MSHRPTSSGTPSGFTLIELLIVVAMIGLIAAIAIPAMQFALDQSKSRATMLEMRRMGSGVTAYYIDLSNYPTGSLTGPDLVPYLSLFAEEVLSGRDHWNHDLAYVSDGVNYYSIESYGRDGLDGANVEPETRRDYNLDILFATGTFRNYPGS